MASILLRIAAFDTPVVSFTLDGRTIRAREGESVLSAILSHGDQLRRHETNGEPRAGFCLMGACQDCWVRLADGRRLRACSTSVVPGMAVLTRTPEREANSHG